ncbi:MAG: hypothetical protein HYR84_04330, partial [Planctomycetes bacterium]|nr:hypothetical protein [Planctomycetota bacterium]
FVMTYGAGIFIEVVSLILGLVWLYQAWRAVLPDDSEYTPGLMVGLLFVPVFNFYWMFHTIPGLSSAIQQETRYVTPARPVSAGWVPGLMACILVLIPFLQPIAVCMFIAWMLIANNALRRMIQIHEQSDAEDSLDDE